MPTCTIPPFDCGNMNMSQPELSQMLGAGVKGSPYMLALFVMA